jgi:Type II secretion system protein C
MEQAVGNTPVQAMMASRETGPVNPNSRSSASTYGRRGLAVLTGLMGLGAAIHVMAQRIDYETQSGFSAIALDSPSAGAIPNSAGARSLGETRFGPPGPPVPGQGSLGGRFQPALAADFQVMGVVFGKAAALALIADVTGNQKMYRSGDSVRPGVVLVEVLRDGVMLATGDERQRLSLRIRAFAGKSAWSDTPITPTGVRARSSAEDPAQGVDRVRRRHQSNPSPDALLPGLFTVHAEGGFELENVKPGSVFARIGLHAGDVLRSANAKPLVSPEQIAVLQQQVLEGGEGEFEVLRNGRPEVLRYGKK